MRPELLGVFAEMYVHGLARAFAFVFLFMILYFVLFPLRLLAGGFCWWLSDVIKSQIPTLRSPEERPWGGLVAEQNFPLCLGGERNRDCVVHHDHQVDRMGIKKKRKVTGSLI